MNTNQPTQTETLFGGSKFEATINTGHKVEVFVRQLPIREMQQYLEAQSNECAIIELVCKLKPEVVDRLTADSHIALLAEIERVNGDFFTKWGERQKGRGEKLKALFLSPQ